MPRALYRLLSVFIFRSSGERVVATRVQRSVSLEPTKIDQHQSDGTCLEERAQIPKIIHFTSGTFPEMMVQYNKFYAEPGTEFRFYDDSAMMASVQEISAVLESEVGLPGAFDAYLSLRAFAFRADLWRLMVLWMHGGLYVDNKIVFTQSVSSWIDYCSDTLVLCGDYIATRFALKKGDHNKTVIWNAIMASTRRNTHILDVIRHVLRNIQHRMLQGVGGGCLWCIYITGPGAVTLGLGDHVPHVPLRFEHESPVDVVYRMDAVYVHENGSALVPGASGDEAYRSFKGDPIYVNPPGAAKPLLIGISADALHFGQQSRSSYRPYDAYCKLHSVYCDQPNLYLGGDGHSDACATQGETNDAPAGRRKQLAFIASIASAGVLVLVMASWFLCRWTAK